MNEGTLIQLGAASPLSAVLQPLSPSLAPHGPSTVLPAAVRGCHHSPTGFHRLLCTPIVLHIVVCDNSTRAPTRILVSAGLCEGAHVAHVAAATACCT